jgi:drug/metabolite transporter (DMT)-like permease
MNKYDWLRIGLNFFELLAFVTGVISFKKIKNSYWKWFVIYLGVIVFAELFAEYLLMVREEPNQWIYVWLVIPLEYLFFFWLFYSYTEEPNFRRWSLLAAFIYAATYVFDMAYLRHLKFAFSSFSYMIGSILLLILLILYFVHLVKGERILHFKKDMMFWVCTGLLIFFLGSFPFYGLWNTLVSKYPKIFNTYWMVQIVFDCIMYLFFAFAFIWGKPK